jgi:hypothetical protein
MSFMRRVGRSPSWWDGMQPRWNAHDPRWTPSSAQITLRAPAGNGQAVKLINQLLVATHTSASAEAAVLAKGMGSRSTSSRMCRLVLLMLWALVSVIGFGLLIPTPASMSDAHRATSSSWRSS